MISIRPLRTRRVFGAARVALAVCAALAVGAAPLSASSRGLIRDAEIEGLLRDMIKPVFQVAGVRNERVRIFIINDPSINAFVSSSSDMFFHTGILRDLKTPEELISVMAHETAHISENHLIQRIQSVEKAQTASLIVQLLGVGAAAAGGGSGSLGASGGLQEVFMRSLLKDIRGQETAADKVGLRFMNRVGADPRGMLRVLQMLDIQSRGAFRDPYVQTHPLSRARIAAVKQGVARSPALGVNLNASPHYQGKQIYYRHARMRAKLLGFLSEPGAVSTDTLGSRELDLYRRAIQLHRAPRPGEAIAAVNQLIKLRPNDPFYWELKGQILAESARGPQAVAPYKKAYSLRPNEPQIARGYGDALLTVKTKDANRRALRVLSKAADQDPFDPTLLRLLADAYSRNGDRGLATVMIARRLALIGRYRDAVRQAKIAKTMLPVGSPGWRQADDIEYIKPRRR